MNLLIMGAPGTGKGTMSNILVEKYGLVHVSTGDMLREAVANKTPVGLKAEEYMNKGALVPDEIIHDIILERLSKDDIKQGFLFDGYPRTLAQAEDLQTILDELNMPIDSVINLNVDDEIIKGRITGRRICKSCGAIYHTANKPSKVEGVCDECGGELYQRKDDTLESLSTRLEAYHSSTKPVIEYYEKMGLVNNIDASKGVNDVFEQIKSILESLG